MPQSALSSNDWRRLAAPLLAFALAGCAGSEALSLVREGRLPEARVAYGETLDQGDVSGARARELAQEVLLRDVNGAEGAAGARTLRAVARCASHLANALSDKASGTDAAAAEAALVRIESGADAEERARIAARRGEPLFRAAGTRALVEGGDAGEPRRAAFLDADPAVRRAALGASADARDARDTEPLIEAARVDPDPFARTLAVRALGRIGGDRVVLAFADMYATADEPLRQGIVAAWSAPACFDVGGRTALLRVNDDRGAPAIAAAHALLSHGGGGAADAAARLARAIDEGPSRDRVYAIAVAPLGDEGVRAALRGAAQDGDEPVRVAALARLYEAELTAGGADGARRRDLENQLVRVAEGETESARAAQRALARGGFRGLLPRLLRDAVSKDPGRRADAGEQLVELGELPRAAALAMDGEPSVRARVACAVLTAPERD